jgi:hypothetical protein
MTHSGAASVHTTHSGAANGQQGGGWGIITGFAVLLV